MIGLKNKFLKIALPVLLLALLLASGCNTIGRGTNQLDIFREMHYSQSYRSQEPPYVMPPAGGVVNFVPGGTATTVDIKDTGRAARTKQTEEDGKELYRVNCVMCHGGLGEGDGPMRAILLKYKGIPPANFVLTSAASSDQEIYDFVSLGGRTAALMAENGVPPLPEIQRPGNMPIFNKLLSEEERWKLVDYIRVLQGQ